METNLYKKLLKEQNKLRNRLFRKSQRVWELLWQVNNLEDSYYTTLALSILLFFLLIVSIILNLYFIFK